MEDMLSRARADEGQLAARWHRYYVKLARRIAPDCGLHPDEAEGEAGLILTLAIRDWDPRKASLKTHLHTRIRLRLIDRARQANGREGRRPRPKVYRLADLADASDGQDDGQLEDVLFLSREPAPWRRLDGDSAARSLLRGLTADERHVLWERCVNKRTYKDIARDLGLSESRALQICHEAVQWLKSARAE